MTAAKHRLRYLKGLSDLAITYKKGQFTINGYTDASFAANPNNRKSTTGCLFLTSGGPLSFGAETQGPTAQSTVDSELTFSIKGGRTPLQLHDGARIQKIQHCADQL